MTQNKALGYLALSRKAGRLALGEEQLAAAVHAGRARLLVLASDIAPASAERLSRLSRDGNPPILTLPATRAELGEAVGRPVCAAAAMTDAGLALALARAVDADAAILAELERRVRRAAKKRK